MPSKAGMPDDEDGRCPVLVRDRAPAEGFDDEAPGHGSPPSDKVGRTGVELMARNVDHEAEAADVIFVGGHEIAPLLGGAAIAAERGDAFCHATMVIGADRRDHDPVGSMISLESLAILLVRFSRQKQTTVNRLPRIVMPVAAVSLGATPFVVGEQFRKRLRDSRPRAILFVPAATRAKGRVDLCIVRSIEMKTAVSGG